jgi:toxin ParE1/3/4
MIYSLTLSPLAQNDLIELQNWITAEASPEVASAYLERLRERIAPLVNFPLKGTPRPEIGKDVRSITFERRVIIGYCILGSVVRVERIISGRRNLDNLL